MGFISRFIALGSDGSILLLGIGMFFIPVGCDGGAAISTVCGLIFLIIGTILILYGLFICQWGDIGTSKEAVSECGIHILLLAQRISSWTKECLQLAMEEGGCLYNIAYWNEFEENDGIEQSMQR